MDLADANEDGDMAERQPPSLAVPPPAATSAPVVKAEDLFRGRREIVIEHEGVRYRLRLTRRNKLILQK
jgi:hemin uptake protein HemP